MATLTRTSSFLALAGVLLAAPVAIAQTQADFDACNQQAAAQVAASSPSASPSTAVGGSITSSSPGTSVGGSVMTAPGSADVNRMPNASGRISGSAGSPGTGVGTGTVAGGGTPATSPSPSTSSTDAGPQGMAAAGQGNTAYQQAFRDCMKARGF